MLPRLPTHRRAQQAAAGRLMGLLLEAGHDDEIVDLLESNTFDGADHARAVLERVMSIYRLGDIEQAAALARSLSGDDLATSERFRLADVQLQVGLINEAIDELEVLLGDPVTEVQLRAGFMLGEVYRAYEMADAAVSDVRACHRSRRQILVSKGVACHG